MGLVAATVLSPADPDFADIEALYLEAFPLGERKPVSFLAEASVRKDYDLIAVRDGPQFAGFAIVYRSALGFALLEYMAVNADLRGNGVGSALFEKVAERIGQTLVLEVELSPTPDPRSIENRRLEFYRRLGAVAVPDLIYHMPKVSTDEPPPMCLMVHGYADANLPRSLLRQWMIDWFDHVYDRREAGESIDIMIDGMGDMIPL